MPNKDELEVRQTFGNGDPEPLCSFGCPFVKTVDDTTCFCLLYRKKLTYIDTGNNELCDRCEECLNDKT